MGKRKRILTIISAVTLMVSAEIGIGGVLPVLAARTVSPVTFEGTSGYLAPEGGMSYCNGGMAYRETSTGVPAYCHDLNASQGPHQSGEYTYELDSSPAEDYIMKYGYPNTRTIGGVTWSDKEAQAITQEAAWMVGPYAVNENTINQVHSESGYGMPRSEHLAAARALVNEANAYHGGDPQIDGASTVMYINSSDPKLTGVQVVIFPSINGSITIEKSSADPDISSGNENYSLIDARYGIYYDSACTNLIQTVTTDEKGKTETVSLSKGTYYVKETQAPKGFDLDTKVYTAVLAPKEAVIVKTTDVPQTGIAKLQKRAADPIIVEKNSCYSLSNAEYGIYTDASCTDLFSKLITQNDGSSNQITLPLGNYFIREITASRGYSLDQEIYSITVKAHETVTVDVSEIPQVNPADLLICKVDAETGLNIPQGGASLTDAQFQVRFYGVQADHDPSMDGLEPLRSWLFKTDENGEIYLSEDYLVSGDEFYFDVNGKPCIPLGTVTIQETEASEGYLCNDTVYVQKIDSQGTEATVDVYQPQEVTEQIIRGDLKFVKVADDTLERMADIPFQITNLNTGESHVIVTDRNGMADTEASWCSHAANTNDGISAEDGIWFGEGTPDDNAGALYYGSYALEELPCDKNMGYKLVMAEIDVYRDCVTVDMGTLTDDRIMIHTTAREKETGSRTVKPDTTVELIDTVSYENLTPGLEYTMRGTLMSKETGQPLEIRKEASIETINEEVVFVPESENGTIDVSFSLDTTGLEGQSLVVFEKLYYGDTEIAVHEDLDDSDQTIEVEKKPEPVQPKKTVEKTTKKVKTGDQAQIFLWSAVCVAACVGSLILGAAIHRGQRKTRRKRGRYHGSIPRSKE